MLDLRRLRYFLVIAERGSLSAAARALNIAQPALSYHLAEMERSLGLTLVLRSRSGVRLTEAGEVLRGHAAGVVQRADRMEAAMAALGRLKSPPVPVRLGIITSLAAALTPLLARVLQDADEAHDLNLSIIETGTREIQNRLARGQIDMGLCLAAGPGFEAEAVARENLLLVAPPGTPDQSDLPFSALADHRLVLPARGNPLRDYLDTRAQAGNVALHVVLEVDGFASRLNSVATGIGATLIGSHPVPPSVRDQGLSVLTFAAPGLVRPLYLGRRPGMDAAIAAQMTRMVAAALGQIGLAPPASGLRIGNVL
jgi:LysR family nitrogen assimilation transcriptional regulator